MNAVIEFLKTSSVTSWIATLEPYATARSRTWKTGSRGTKSLSPAGWTSI
jgi:hypothetical protein